MTYPAAPHVQTAPTTAPAIDSTPTKTATTALGLGISGAVVGSVPVVGAVLGGTAVGYGIAALRKKRPQDRKQAFTGLWLGAFGLVTSAIITSVWISVATWDASVREEVFGEVLAVYGLDEAFGVGVDDDAVDEAEVAPAPSVGAEGFPMMTDAGFASIVSDPIGHEGQQNRLFGEIQYVEEGEDFCNALLIVDDAQQTDWEDYAFPMWAIETTAVSCGDLSALGDFTHVAIDVTWRGSMTTHWDDDTVDDVLMAEIAAVTVLEPLEG